MNPNYWALTAEGDGQQNCAAMYLGDVLAGDCYLYSVRVGGERATLLLCRRRAMGWSLSALKARQNQPVSAETERYVRAWLNNHAQQKNGYLS
jgi:hypothetical protein